MFTVLVRDATRYSYPLKVGLVWYHWERPKRYKHDSSEVVPDPF